MIIYIGIIKVGVTTLALHIKELKFMHFWSESTDWHLCTIILYISQISNETLNTITVTHLLIGHSNTQVNLLWPDITLFYKLNLLTFTLIEQQIHVHGNYIYIGMAHE